jgi:hypothetical protein
MLTNRIKQRLQQYLDGELSPDKKKQVQELMEHDSEVKDYYEKLIAMEKMLKEDIGAAATVDLENEIISQLSRSQSISTVGTDRERWFGFIPASPQWTLLPALVLGILIGFFIFSPVLKKKHLKDLSTMDLAGTMTGHATSAFALPINLAGVNATINADYISSDFLRINLRIQSEQESQIRMSFNKDQFNVWNMKAVNPTGDSRILADYQSVAIINRGDNDYFVLLKKLNDAEEPFKVEVFYDDMLQYQTVVTIK